MLTLYQSHGGHLMPHPCPLVRKSSSNFQRVEGLEPSPCLRSQETKVQSGEERWVVRSQAHPRQQRPRSWSTGSATPSRGAKQSLIKAVIFIVSCRVGGGLTDSSSDFRTEISKPHLKGLSNLCRSRVPGTSVSRHCYFSHKYLWVVYARMKMAKATGLTI